MNAASAILVSLQGVEVTYDRASGTYALSERSIAEVERTMADGTLACLVEARELHAKGRSGEAHRLQLLVHLRGLELRSEAMCVAALNICREAHGCEPARSSKAAS